MDGAKKQKISRNSGKVQFLASKELISEMLSLGYNYRNVHERLMKEHDVTMSYHTFCFWMRKFSEQQPEKAIEKNSTSLPVITTGTTPKGKFMRPENVDSKGLF